MAKGQVRSSKEKRKPKASKAAPADNANAQTFANLKRVQDAASAKGTK